MAFSSRSYVNPYIPSSRFPPGLRWLLIANIAIFILAYIFKASRLDSLFSDFRLVPAQVVQTFAVWQLVTYMFLHSGIGHILWNMLALWMFGVELEKLWGTKRFLKFYFICGICAGLTVVISAYVFGDTETATVGSSGAILGILMAYGITFAEQTILFGFIFPMKAKYFVMIVGAIVFLQSYSATIGKQRGSVAVMAHLGGLITGYLLLRGKRLRSQIKQPAVASLKEWKLRRAKKKFQVYLSKKDSNRDRWVH